MVFKIGFNIIIVIGGLGVSKINDQRLVVNDQGQ